MSTKIVVAGAGGRMGQRILALATADKAFEIVGRVETKSESGSGFTSDLASVVQKADAVIEFTTPEATAAHVAMAATARKAMVIGTTGLSEKDLLPVRQAAQQIPVVLSPNMSLGVNVLLKLVDMAARILSQYQIEISEIHHIQKKDAPSGTALKLGEIVAQALKRDLKTIGISSLRLGDVVGDHTVHFGGPGERLELTHRATSRDTFAAGALTAARWVVSQKPGLYDMQDVLGLK